MSAKERKSILIHNAGNGSVRIRPMRASNSLRRCERFTTMSHQEWTLASRYCVSTLRRRFKQDGYLYLPSFLDETQVRAARRAVLLEIQKRNGLSTVHELDEAIPSEKNRVSLLALPEVARLPAVVKVIESRRLFELFRALFDDANIGTLSFKWLRAVANGEFTGVHIDRVYVGQQTDRLMTAWIPIGDVPLENGSLAVCSNSHRHDNPAFEQMHRVYGRSSVGQDGTNSGWLSDNAADVKAIPSHALQWLSTDFRAGDVLVLNIDTVHMTLKNTTNRLRISCDTRWQPLSEPSKTKLNVAPR